MRKIRVLHTFITFLCVVFLTDSLARETKLSLNDIDISKEELVNKLNTSKAEPQTEKKTETKKKKRKKRKKKFGSKKTKKEKKLHFQFENTPLVDIINLIASECNFNVVFPQGKDVIKTKINFSLDEKIPLSLAKEYMLDFLDLAGYTMHPESNFFIITKKSDVTSTREPLHLYVNIQPDKLPKGRTRIRAIYYLSNFMVPESTQGNEPLNLILKDMLSERRNYLFDPKSNAIIITDYADKIASVMTIILELDKTGSPETVEVVPLFNSTATTIARLLNEQIIATTSNSRERRLRSPIKTPSGLYFTPNTRVVADQRTNSLILIGTESAVARIKEFVRDYMDAPAETGKSILHVYDLQYLDAREFAQVLQNIVRNSSNGQSEKEFGGITRFFHDVIIVAETEQAVESKTVGQTTTITRGRVTVGGNRLIIAATEDDWLQLKELIEKLDKPQLQVIIEVMVLDITVDGLKALEAQTRKPLGLGLPQNMQFQAAQMAAPILDANNKTLTSDLLRLLGGTPDTSIATTETSGDSAGSMIISFNDVCQEGIWGLLKILDKWIEKRVISHPFLVTKNNIKAKESLTTIRRSQGPIKDDKSGVTTVLQKDYKAVLSIEATPRTSSQERLNLQIKVDIEDFIDPTSGFDRSTRSVETNANMRTGQVLIIGGLTKVTDTEAETKWPILGDIPIIGTLFRGTGQRKVKNNLAIFIHPTIIEPKLRAGQTKFSDETIKKEYKTLNEGELFSGTRDPIIRFFFDTETVEDGFDMLTEYLESTHYKQAKSEREIKNLLKNEANPLDYSIEN